jgi:hypothetical protein
MPSLVPQTPQVSTPVSGLTRQPVTSLSASVLASRPLRVRLQFDTPPLVGARLCSARFSTTYTARDTRRARLFHKPPNSNQSEDLAHGSRFLP